MPIIVAGLKKSRVGGYPVLLAKKKQQLV